MAAVATVTAYDLAVTAPAARRTKTSPPPRRINGIPVYEQEFWTSKQRQANPLHEVSYRGCFKPQLPGYFIDRLSKPGDFIYDPFSGRGTTAVEAALMGNPDHAAAGSAVDRQYRRTVACDQSQRKTA